MGTSSLYTIRHRTRDQTNNHLTSFTNKFRTIIHDSSLSKTDIQKVVNADLVEIIQLLNSHKILSIQLVAIFGLRIIFIAQAYHAITQDHFQFALEAAKECDIRRSKTGLRNWTLKDGDFSQKYLPPLFGVPISVKDNIQMASTRSTVGLTARANRIINQDSPIVRCFKNSGIIPFVKTNIPQMGFTTQTNNFIWGRCLNPWNTLKSSGGSSGGEAVCIATKCSLIGVGNDYGGSVRIPAQFCGISALLPSTHRIQIHDAITDYSLAFNGKDFIKNMNGPLAKNVDSLALWTCVTTNQHFYDGYHDPYLKLIPFNAKVYQKVSLSAKKLKIGYFENLELIQCTPACSRAVRQTIAFLKSEGHELIQIKIPYEDEVIYTMFADSLAQGGLGCFRDMLQGQPLAPQYRMMSIMGKITGWTFKILKAIIKPIQPRVALIMQASKKLTTHQYLQKMGRGYQLREEWSKYWKQNKLDCVICAGFGSEATNHNTYDKVTFLAAYTFIWNILAMTACSIPITIVREEQQKYESKWKDQFTKGVRQTVANSIGLPVGIQVVGLPFSQELILGISKKIEGHFKFSQKYKISNLPEVDYGCKN